MLRCVYHVHQITPYILNTLHPYSRVANQQHTNTAARSCIEVQQVQQKITNRDTAQTVSNKWCSQSRTKTTQAQPVTSLKWPQPQGIFINGTWFHLHAFLDNIMEMKEDGDWKSDQEPAHGTWSIHTAPHAAHSCPQGLIGHLEDVWLGMSGLNCWHTCCCLWRWQLLAPKLPPGFHMNRCDTHVSPHLYLISPSQWTIFHVVCILILCSHLFMFICTTIYLQCILCTCRTNYSGHFCPLWVC